MVLTQDPAVVLVTVTDTVQKPDAGTVPPVRATLPPFAAAVTVPPQVVDAAGEAAFVICAGYVSVNATPVSGTAFGLVSVMVRTLVCPNPIGVVPKLLATDIADKTDNVAFTPLVFRLADAPVTRLAPFT
jgi:hypothetical protein